MSRTYKPMSLPMKIVFWFVVANAALGAISLIFFPTTTESTFFWQIAPPINARMFGVLYVAAGMLVLLAVLRGQWESARTVDIMVPFFTGMLLLTTILHMDRFVQDFRFYYWLIIYIVAPLAAIIFYLQHERGGANWQIVSQPVLSQVRMIAVALGAFAALFVVFCYIFPNLITAIWPWPISELMVRVFVSWMSALAAGLLWFWREPDWSRVAQVPTMMVVAAGLMLVVLIIHSRDLNPDSPGGWVFGAMLIGEMLLAGYMHWVQRRSAVSSQQSST